MFVLGAMTVHALPVLPYFFWSFTAFMLGGFFCFSRSKIGDLSVHIGLFLIGIGTVSFLAHSRLENRLLSVQEGCQFIVHGWVDTMAVSRGDRFDFVVESCHQEQPNCPIGKRLRLNWNSRLNYSKKAMSEFKLSDQKYKISKKIEFNQNNISTDDPLVADRKTIAPGQRWQLSICIKRPHALHNPGLFDAELRALEENISGFGYVKNSEYMIWNKRLMGFHWSIRTIFESMRNAIRIRLEHALASVKPETKGIVLALVVGDQSAIPSYWWTIFNRTGVGHLVSISGLHITMLSAFSVFFSRLFLRIKIISQSGLLLRFPAPTLSWLIGVLVAFYYSGLSGWGIPAQRTCWMLAVVGLAFMSGRSRSMFHILVFACALATMLDPWAPLSAGFWLSFGTVSAIIFASSAYSNRVTKDAINSDIHGFSGMNNVQKYRSCKIVIELIKIFWEKLKELTGEWSRSQWASTLVLLPLGAIFFSSVSRVGPIANAFAVPLVSLIVTPMAMLGTVLLWIFPVGGVFLLKIAAFLLDLLLQLLEWLAQMPMATQIIAHPTFLGLMFSVVAVALLLWPVPFPSKTLALAGFLPLLIHSEHSPPAAGLRITALDIGQGMSVLIETAHHRLLYDTGPAWGEESEQDTGARVIVPYLFSKGIGYLDAVMVSHSDIDHSGGLMSILSRIKVGWILGSLRADHPVRALPSFGACDQGKGWQWDGVKFELLHPDLAIESVEDSLKKSNASSCVLHIKSPTIKVLIAGDIEAKQEKNLVAQYGHRLQADLLFAPHHGSNSSSTLDWIRAVDPKHVVVQVGYRNRYHHPARRVVSRYHDLGIPLFRSDRDGSITFYDVPGRPLQLSRSRIDNPPYWRIILE